MARLGLKIFYLRTRERQMSQQALADALGIRQATVSQIEQGVAGPSCPLLLELCKFFDVTPTFLLEDERGVIPLPSERWSMRQALVTVGMWIEAPADAVLRTGDGKVLCPLLPGESFYDDEAMRVRVQQRDAVAANAKMDRRQEELHMARALQGELRAHPLRRGKRRASAKRVAD